MEADRIRGVSIDHREGQVTVREYAEHKYLPSLVHLRPNSVQTYRSHLNAYIYRAIGDRRIGSLMTSDMKAFVAAMSASLAPSTVHTVFSVLRALMQSATNDQIRATNPCSRVPLPEIAAHVLEPLSAASVLDVASSMTPRYQVTVWLAAGAGLREGEALGLTVPRVDFPHRRLIIQEQAQSGRLAPLKTKASRRAIPADDTVLEKIAAHMQRFKPCPEGVVLTNRCGRIAQRNSFGWCWREAVEDAGLPEGTRFHDLRHFYASTLIAAGLHPKVIQARLGHATLAETMDTYGHLFPDAEDAGRGAIDAMLSAAPAELGRNRESS
jgi:integrase